MHVSIHNDKCPYGSSLIFYTIPECIDDHIFIDIPGKKWIPVQDSGSGVIEVEVHFHRKQSYICKCLEEGKCYPFLEKYFHNARNAVAGSLLPPPRETSCCIPVVVGENSQPRHYGCGIA